jgi:epoxyqueuosine reductase
LEAMANVVQDVPATPGSLAEISPGCHGWADAIRKRAHELGFDGVGFARADEPLTRDKAHFDGFIAHGMHGDMGYLAQHAEARERLDGEAILPGAKTVICLARRYDRGEEAEASDPPLAKGIARYARGRDYHSHLHKRVAKLARFVRGLAPGVVARALCDTAPVLERAWAQRAGLGFIGKNGMLIVPGQGSYCLLAEVVTKLALDASTERTTERWAERCGSCTLCLDACPTDAFVRPFVLEPRRCISYHTIESRSAPPPALQPALGSELFGCDICQQVCPYNHVAPPAAEQTEAFSPLERWHHVAPADWLTIDEDGFRTLTQSSPLRRATRAGMARNVVLMAARRLRSAGSTGDAEARALLDRGVSHDEPSVRQLAKQLLETD